MEISGKIIQVLDLQQGTSKAGNAWKKQEYVLETQDMYPKKVKFDFFGDRVDQYKLAIGDEVTVSFDLESREFNGRWYTDVRAWKAEKAGAATVAPMSSAEPQAPYASVAPAAPMATPVFDAPAGDESDDLPF